jgi:hypothetical protein
MKFLHVQNENEAKQIDKFIQDGKHVFILVYMEGCGPCNETRPEWAKLEKILTENDNNVVIIDVNQDFLNHIDSIGEVDGFPTMKYISQKHIEDYNGERTAEHLVAWIQSKIAKKGGGKKRRRGTRSKRKRTGKKNRRFFKKYSRRKRKYY